MATSRFAAAESLLRRALAIDEANLGAEHPAVGRDLSSLAQLLMVTNRLAEAEPLNRRTVRILVGFTRRTGHEHPHLETALGHYRSLLRALGRTDEEVQTALESLRDASE